MTQLSKNFTLDELTKSEYALRQGINNDPSSTEIKNLVILCDNILQPLRNHYRKPIMINSAFRSSVVNAAIGGSKTSDHCRGMAADIEVSGVSNAALAKLIASKFKFTQVILEFYTPNSPTSGWVHVSYDANNLKCQTLTAMREDGKVVYKPGLMN